MKVLCYGLPIAWYCVITSSAFSTSHGRLGIVRSARPLLHANTEVVNGEVVRIEEVLVDQDETLKAVTSDATTTSNSSTTKVDVVKRRLLDVLPTFTGKNMEENILVEGLINELEEDYKNSPLSKIQTVAFFGLAIGGEWDLVMSTNMLAKTKTDDLDDFVEWKLSLTSPIKQKINTENRMLVSTVNWKLLNEDSSDELKGSFSSKSQYELVNQSTRLFLTLEDHSLDNKSKRVPTESEVNMLVGKLIEEMTIEVFDPNGLSVDTTYVDEELRIIRYTSASGKSEGVRNIFLRRASKD